MVFRQPEEDRLAAVALQQAQFLRPERHRARSGLEVAKKRAVLPEREDPRVRVSEMARQCIGVIAKVIGAIEAGPGIGIASLLHPVKSATPASDRQAASALRPALSCLSARWPLPKAPLMLI